VIGGPVLLWDPANSSHECPNEIRSADVLLIAGEVLASF
jgi:hypothetical protein